MNDLILLQDLFGNFCLVFTAPAKWRIELRAKLGQYRNRCFCIVVDDDLITIFAMIPSRIGPKIC